MIIMRLIMIALYLIMNMCNYDCLPDVFEELSPTDSVLFAPVLLAPAADVVGGGGGAVVVVGPLPAPPPPLFTDTVDGCWVAAEVAGALSSGGGSGVGALSALLSVPSWLDFAFAFWICLRIWNWAFIPSSMEVARASWLWDFEREARAFCCWASYSSLLGW